MEDTVGRIVVGVDGSRSSRRALDMALRTAEMSKDEVDVVHVWESLSPVPYAHTTTSSSPMALRHAAWNLLSIELSEVDIGSDSLERVRPVVKQGRPSAVLIELAKGARFVVLGSGHDYLSYSGNVGSVALEVIRHAPCPVVVVPAINANEFLEERDNELVVHVAEHVAEHAAEHVAEHDHAERDHESTSA